METLSFRQLNVGWNAEPNAPFPSVEVVGRDILLRFRLNPFRYPDFAENDAGMIRFKSCSRYRVGSTNDEGWYRGQCRYSKTAPAWGEFYELIGPDDVADLPNNWASVGSNRAERHFLFYFRDETFECFAEEWAFEPVAANSLARLIGNARQ